MMKKILKFAGILLAGVMLTFSAACGTRTADNFLGKGETLPNPNGTHQDAPSSPDSTEPLEPNEPIEPTQPTEPTKPEERVEGKYEPLLAANSAQPLSNEVWESEDYLALLASAEKFAARFAPEAVKLSQESNVAVSPISVYMALALSEICAANETQREIQTALFTSHEILSGQLGNLYCGLNRETYDDGGLLVSKLALANSIWVQQNYPVRTECLKTLAENAYCSSYSADFASDNKAANAAVRDYIKEQTRGLIDQDFKLSEDTRVALINALYLKDVWDTLSGELSYMETEQEFMQGDGTVECVPFLNGTNEAGKPFETETFRHFFLQTRSGYRLKFLVPQDGHTAEEIFTEDNLRLVAEMEDYHASDEDCDYYTRCLFPKFEAKYNEQIEQVLENMGIRLLFKPQGCDLSTLSDDPLLYFEKVQHAVKLKVDEKGVEGAAVTVMAGIEGEIPRKKVYSDFFVDRAFGFILTDRSGATLFSGIVRDV